MGRGAHTVAAEKREEGLPLKNYELLNHGQEISRFLKSAAQGIFSPKKYCLWFKSLADGFIKVTFIMTEKWKKTFLK